MSNMKEHLNNISWAALTEGAITIDGITYDVWGSQQLKDSLNDSLDDGYEMFKIGQLSFSPSAIVSSCDPVAYEMMLSEEADVMYDLETLVYGFTLEDAIMNASDLIETNNITHNVKEA